MFDQCYKLLIREFRYKQLIQVQNTEQFIDYIDCYMIYDISNIKKNVIT